MMGMDARTGKALNGDAHLAQSIADILSTPVGTRLMRRDYGSRVPDLIDAPANAATRVQLYAATATALMRWEPRITVKRVALSVVDAMAGRWVLDLMGTRADTGAAVELSVPVTLPGARA
ncbi:GPW/gp25 family protein [Dyella sp.]|uniref:GPW/gp25 family protein n=1 Tax=Dyella sp. TaxID=1869338 RepID=UPI002B46EDD8|nr:GPW/gp25 family protein [Dyella sp.]HKT28803.1 GPW/gp25 family protein [Dyella sp.]